MLEYTVEVLANGTRYWYLKGVLHREDGPAVEYSNGIKCWYLNGEQHREGAPAIEYPSGTKYWLLKGKLHREGGPAIEFASGTRKWYFDDEELTEEEFLARTTKTIVIDGIKYKLVKD